MADVEHPRTSGGLLAIVVVVATVLTRLPGLLASRAFNSDEATLAVGGRVLAGGGSLYVDFIDRKPPLPFALYGVVQRLSGTDDLRPVRLLVAMSIAAAALVAASEADRRWGRRSAWVAGIALVLGASALGPADAQAANFELFALLPITVAVVAAARGRAAVAGVALAVAVLCKQPAAVTAVPVAWSLWRARRGRGLVVGSVAGLAATLLLAAPFGIGLVLQWALLGTGGYLGLAVADIGAAAVRLLALVAIAVAFWGGAWLLALAPTVSSRRHPHQPSTGRRADLDLWLLLGVSVLGVIAGFRFFPHYLLQLLPAVALLAACGAGRHRSLLPAAGGWAAVASLVALVLAVVAGTNAVPPVERNVSAYVRAHSSDDQRILVWGNYPEIYWRSGRDPAGGFSHTEFLTGYSGGRRHSVATQADVPDVVLYRRYVARLRRERPVLIIDTAATDERGGKFFPISGFGDLTALLRSDYRRVITIDRVPIYRLRTDGGSGAGTGSGTGPTSGKGNGS